MNVVGIAQPDVTLTLDLDGVIRDVTVSNTLSRQDVSAWIGRPWTETVADTGDRKVRRMVEDAVRRQVSAFRQVTQRFPSGLELLMEYTTIRLGDDGGLIAVGKSLQAVTELQSRLLSAQQEMEREFWKLRELETRYRLLFDNSSEAVVLLRAANLRVLEANPAAVRALGLAPERQQGITGRDFLQEIAARERDLFQSMLRNVRDHGKAPGMMVHLGRDAEPWLVRASLMTAETGLMFLVQLAPVAVTQTTSAPEAPAVSVEAILDRGPEGLAVLDASGIVIQANAAFRRQMGLREGELPEGRPITAWLQWTVSAPDPASQRRSAMATVLNPAGTASVEVIHVGPGDAEGGLSVVLVRVAPRPDLTSADPLCQGMNDIVDQVGHRPLTEIVNEGARRLEVHCLRTALESASGDPASAAGRLGLSIEDFRARLARLNSGGGTGSGRNT